MGTVYAMNTLLQLKGVYRPTHVECHFRPWAAVTAMKRWHVNAVRVPLNEACWNGQSYVRSRYRGVNYRRAVSAYVRLLNRNGMVAILDLHWPAGASAGPSASCSSAQARCQKPMPDAAQSIRSGPRWLRRSPGTTLSSLISSPSLNQTGFRQLS